MTTMTLNYQTPVDLSTITGLDRTLNSVLSHSRTDQPELKTDGVLRPSSNLKTPQTTSPLMAS
jgi:hypothetical protein